MGSQKLIYIGNGVGIRTPQGDIKIFVREVGGTHENRTGKVEIHGSQLVPDGSLV